MDYRDTKDDGDVKEERDLATVIIQKQAQESLAAAMSLGYISDTVTS